MLVERREGHAAFCGQRQKALPPVIGRTGFDDEAALDEAAQDATEVAVIEPEFRGDLGCGPRGPLRKLVEHARLGERIGTSEKTVLEHADAPRVEAIEAANRADARLEIDCGYRCHGGPGLWACLAD